MITEGKIFVGKSVKPEYMDLKLANRHGLITGATGTGKTVSLQVLAEGFSDAGVPVFAADIKGDLSGIAAEGTSKDFIDKRLVEVGRAAGCTYAQLVQRASDIDWRALDGIRAVGVTAGASAPEVLVNEVIDAFRARYDTTVDIVETATENVEFKVPRVLREPA